MSTAYLEFLDAKAQRGAAHGFESHWIPDSLFDFQKHLTEWAIRQGRAAIFADCGMGKTPMQLVWAENVVRETNGRVLILTPLAVAQQTVREGEKFGIECHRSHGGLNGARITVANYEQLHHFQPEDFQGVVCDESSILKNFDGQRRQQITEFLRTRPYRLLCTATAAPNDYIELGTSSEALGELGQMDVLTRFFRNDQNNIAYKRQRAWGGKAQGWRFKGHAEEPFWRWVCSWARACRRPSDLGFPDDGFVLPPLTEHERFVEARTAPEGMLFNLPASNWREEREERRRTLTERCEAAAAIANRLRGPCVVWCHLNDEGDLLERLIPDARQVSGKDSDDAKEEAYDAFSTGILRVLVTKPKIGAWGLNWQHCANVVTFASHSYEQYYQAVRRWIDQPEMSTGEAVGLNSSTNSSSVEPPPLMLMPPYSLITTVAGAPADRRIGAATTARNAPAPGTSGCRRCRCPRRPVARAARDRLIVGGGHHRSFLGLPAPSRAG